MIGNHLNCKKEARHIWFKVNGYTSKGSKSNFLFASICNGGKYFKERIYSKRAGARFTKHLKPKIFVSSIQFVKLYGTHQIILVVDPIFEGLHCPG